MPDLPESALPARAEPLGTLPIDEEAEDARPLHLPAVVSGPAAASSPVPRQARPAPARSRGRGRTRWLAAAGILALGGAWSLARVLPEQPLATATAKAGGNDVRAGALFAGLFAAERAKDWPLCQQRAQELLDLPTSALGPQDRQRAEQALERSVDEGRNLLTYDRFMQSVMQRAPNAAVLAFAELSEGSVYRELGAVHYLEMRKGFVKDHLARAHAAAFKGGAQGCRAAQPHIDAILAVDPAAAVDGKVRALHTRCSAPAAQAQAGPAQAGPAQAQDRPAVLPESHLQKGALASGDPTFLAREDQEKTMEDAQHAYIQGEYRQAIQIARRHTRTDPVRAWRVIGGAACYLGDAVLVRQTLTQLTEQRDDPAQRFVHQVCARNGLTP